MTQVGGFDRKALVGFITEIEASRDRAKGETRHQSEILKKAREKGFEPKAMRKVLQRRAMSTVDRDSIDEAVDLYEHALGALADAREAVEAGMSAREAAEKFDVPRAALGVIARGSRNAISEPSTDSQEDSVLSGRGERSDEVSREPAGEAAGNAGGSHDAGLTTFGQEVARVAPPELGAGAEGDSPQRVASPALAMTSPPLPPSAGDDPNPIPSFLRRNGVASRKSATPRGGSDQSEGTQ